MAPNRRRKEREIIARMKNEIIAQGGNIPTDEEVQLPDGIAGTSVDNPTAIYDLSGRKVATVRHPGVYIINGKLEVIQ